VITTPSPGSAVHLDGVGHAYGSTVAVDDVTLSVRDGEVLALVGPSGCGKSTLLRLIAGLLTPSSGSVWLGRDDATRLRAERRGIGYVPQSYALFPHLSVRENVAYGLAAQRVPRGERGARIDEALELTRMTDFASRMPAELSGGQRQRVALARALAIRPTVLLLDEPLSALDPQLRDGMRRDLRALLSAADCTTIIVTHDQSEALALADRVAVMRAGRVVQADTVDRIWNHPAEPFVAEFVAGAAVLPARVTDRRVHLADDWKIPREAFSRSDAVAGASAFVVVRPDNGASVYKAAADDVVGALDPAVRDCVVVDAEPRGSSWALRVRLLTDGIADPRWPEITVAAEEPWLPGTRLRFELRMTGTTVHRDRGRAAGPRASEQSTPSPTIRQESRV
jgi:ABC-type Fe3+/spermidine/putrescine transport system ATPase subunit